MTKLEMLNVFVNDRLTAAADDIFRAVKEAVVEYQAELLRSKEENERLKRLLSAAVQRLLLQPEPQSGHVPENGELLEPEWRCAVEPVPLVKVEPKLKSDCLDEGCSAEETCCVSKAAPETSSLHIKAERVEPPVSEPQQADLHPLSPLSTALRTHKRPGSGSGAVLRSNGNPPGLPRPNTPPHSLHKWHSCRECGKGFSFACQLEVHMRWHTKEKPYCCAVCRKSFTTVSMLKRHHRIHTGEKPFHCHVCGKRFNQSAHLNTHFRLHTRERAGRNRTPLC